MPLEAGKVKAVATAAKVDALKELFGLSGWTINVGVGAISDGGTGNSVKGQCIALYDYSNAVITLNPDALDSRKDAEATLRHELFHCVIAPFDLFNETVQQFFSSSDDAKIRLMLDRLYNHVIEKTVENMERMYDRMTDKAADKTKPEEGRGKNSA